MGPELVIIKTVKPDTQALEPIPSGRSNTDTKIQSWRYVRLSNQKAKMGPDSAISKTIKPDIRYLESVTSKN